MNDSNSAVCCVSRLKQDTWFIFMATGTNKAMKRSWATISIFHLRSLHLYSLLELGLIYQNEPAWCLKEGTPILKSAGEAQSSPDTQVHAAVSHDAMLSLQKDPMLALTQTSLLSSFHLLLSDSGLLKKQCLQKDVRILTDIHNVTLRPRPHGNGFLPSGLASTRERHTARRQHGYTFPYLTIAPECNSETYRLICFYVYRWLKY